MSPKRTLLTDDRLRLYPRLVLAAVIIAIGIVLATSDGARTISGTLGGDLGAFYGAAEIVASGRSHELYNWSAQREVQRDFHPEEPGSFLPFAYPPFVVLPFIALRSLGFVGGWLMHTAVMGGLLWIGVLALRPMLPRVGAYAFPLFVLLLTFYPLFRAVLGGQNTALSFAILAVTWRLLHDGRDFGAGAIAALLLFKPQFGLPLLGLLLLTRRPRVLAGALCTAVVLYAAGAWVGGIGWPVWWWSQVGAFQSADQSVNASNSVGFLGFFEAVIGPGSYAAVLPGVLLSVAAAAVAMRLWWKRTTEPVLRWAFTAVALVLIPPHAMFYDAGLAGIALVCLLGRGHMAVAAGAWGGAWLGPLSGPLGFNPLFVVLLVVAISLLGLEQGGTAVERRNGTK